MPHELDNRRARRCVVPMVAVMVACAAARPVAATAVAAAELMPETLRAWEQYVSRTEARITRDMGTAGTFLTLDGTGDVERARAALRRGTLLVTEVDQPPDGRVEVPSGTIHHWRGAIFIPRATLATVLAAAADPAGHRQEDLLDARVLQRRADGLRLFLKLQRTLIVSAVYNTEHDVRFVHHGARRASSSSVATRIAEVEGHGTASEHELPPGMDRGFLWRLNAYWRYEEAEGGVFVEVESLSLSRGVPWGLGTVVKPLANRVARESMVRTLETLRNRLAIHR